MKDNSDKTLQQKEIQSLTGRIDKNAMGKRDEKAKPKKAVNTSQKNNKSSSNITFKSGSLFE